MRAALFVLACLAVHVFAQSYPGNITVTSITSDGFDTIHLDTPSWVTAMQHSSRTYSLILYGSTVTRMVNDQTFSANAIITGPQWSENFMEVDYFHDQSGTPWAVGTLAAPQGRSVQPVGYELLVALVGGPSTDPPAIVSLGNHSGFIPTAIRNDGYQLPNLTTYFIGYQGTPTGNGVNWGILRTTSNLNAPSVNTFSYSNSTYDQAVINSFPFYVDENNQNFVIHDPVLQTIYIVDNYADVIHTIQLPFTNQSMAQAKITTFDISAQTWGYVVSSAAYDPTLQNLYVGLAANGQGTGAMAIYNVRPGNNPSLITTVQLPTNYSNPRAIVIDYNQSSLYIGTNGGPGVLKYSLNSGNLVGYQLLPEYLHRLWIGQDGGEHVYFATYEQHSKVFRVNKNDFCSTPCSSMAYCLAGKCMCNDFTEMLDGICQPKTYVKEILLERRVHGGETALGILFMFAVIAAAAGWFLFWRQRRGATSYQPVL